MAVAFFASKGAAPMPPMGVKHYSFRLHRLLQSHPLLAYDGYRITESVMVLENGTGTTRRGKELFFSRKGLSGLWKIEFN